MFRCGVLARSVLPRHEIQVIQTAGVVYGEKGRTWKYDPDFEPTEPCLRAGLKGNPYGTRRSPFKSTVVGRKLYRLPLKHPLWKDVYQTLDDVGVGRDWLDLTIPAVLPEFPMESKKQNPYYTPGKYPTIRNAYFEQQQIQFAAEKQEHIREFHARKRRLQNRWQKERAKHDTLRKILAEINPQLSEIDPAEIESQTKELEGSTDAPQA